MLSVRHVYGSATRTGKAVTQRIDNAESAADWFANKSQKSSTSENRYYRGTHTRAAEKMILREFAFHKAFLVGTAIIASVLFAIVWARFK